MAVIGHEIGHVLHSDSKDAMKNAYLTSAAKNAAGATSDVVAKLSDSQLGDLATALAGAQYSQKQENEADDYGFEFSVANGLDPYSMHNSLNKLMSLSEDAIGNHPNFARCFQAILKQLNVLTGMKEKADEYMKDKN